MQKSLVKGVRTRKTGIGYFLIKLELERMGKKRRSRRHVPFYSKVREFGKSRSVKEIKEEKGSGSS